MRHEHQHGKTSLYTFSHFSHTHFIKYDTLWSMFDFKFPASGTIILTDWSGDILYSTHTNCEKPSEVQTNTFLMAYLGSSGMTRRIFPSQNSATTRSFFQPWKHNREKLQLQTHLPMKQTHASSLGRRSLQNSTSNINKLFIHFSGRNEKKWSK